MTEKSLLPVRESCAAKRLRGYAHPAISEAQTPPKGSRTLEEAKSKRLKTVREQILKLASGPKLNAQRPPRAMLRPITAAEAFLRDQPNCSVQNDMEISDMEMVEVSEAIKSSMKNRGARIRPPAIAPKIAGSVSNTRVGPAVGDMPKLNTAGKIIIPDRIATRVSSEAILTAVRGMMVESLKYEP